jgi:hypothetical protein
MEVRKGINNDQFPLALVLWTSPLMLGDFLIPNKTKEKQGSFSVQILMGRPVKKGWDITLKPSGYYDLLGNKGCNRPSAA